MNEAQEAIQTILEALDEYGTTITLRKVTVGTYNPLSGTTDIVVDTNVQALISNNASRSVSQQIQGNEALSGYDMSVLFYHTETPSTAWKVVYNGDVYNVTLVAPYTLQNTIFKYELLVRK